MLTPILGTWTGSPQAFVGSAARGQMEPQALSLSASPLTPPLPLTVKGVVCVHVDTPAACLTLIYTPQLMLMGHRPWASGVVGLGRIDLGRGPCRPWK